VLLVVPNLMGVCIWSPKLDEIGNSVRGVEMAAKLVETYNLHIYDCITAAGDKINPRVSLAQWRASLTSEALWAASRGDLRTLRRLHGEQIDLQQGDYDLRSPMHLAAAEGHAHAVSFLLECGVDPNRPDRWGGTPLEDAVNGNHESVIAVLQEHEAELGEGKHVSTDGDTDEAILDGNADRVVELLWAAAKADLRGLQTALANGIPIHAADYDGRTALHLGAAEGNEAVVRYLLAHGHPIHVRDRWNSTPLDEAKRENRTAVIDLLEAAQRSQPSTRMPRPLPDPEVHAPHS
ncbi:MAG: ankyrin repeat domain-containing protein, partial [Myxococcota bacterium]|nr:ankyrin repeat domain-containing protein [Myxococcota bacterium]